jgi:hypothetical protein
MKSFSEAINILVSMWNKLNREEKNILAILIVGNKE